jgi:hypothetical protein
MLALFAVIWQTKAGVWLAEAVLWIMNLFGVPEEYHQLGGYLFQFWHAWGINFGL